MNWVGSAGQSEASGCSEFWNVPHKSHIQIKVTYRYRSAASRRYSTEISYLTLGYLTF